VNEYAKAQIQSIEEKADKAVECMFNPKEYTFTKKNSWSAPKNKGGNVPEYEFGGGEPASLTLQLFFDTFETGEDVRTKHTDAVWKLMMVDERLRDRTSQKARPPRVRFQWGQAWSFDAVIMSITQKFTLFGKDGRPLRATLDVTFQQVKDELFYPKQTSTAPNGAGGRRQATVKAGDNLASIAHEEYGDPAQWRPIADANRLTNVRDLKPGTPLELPALD
jgi:nucleoid-associated protein YgaU